MTEKTKFLLQSIFLLTVLIFLNINCDSTGVKKGGIYSVINNDESYCIVKIISIADTVLEIELYPNKFSSRPKEISGIKLDPGLYNDSTVQGVLRFAISSKTFLEWTPERLN